MTGTQIRPERASIRSRDGVEAPRSPAVPEPGPMSVFVVLIAIAVGLVAALAFRTANPDTPLIILGGSFLSAGLLALIGLYRYKWFLFATLALRPALDDLTADEFGSFQPSAILGILVIGVSALHLISRRATGNWRRMTPMSWAMIGFLLAFAPSYLLSVDRGVSQAAMFGLASVVLLYLAMEQLLQERRDNIWGMLLASGLGLVVPIIVGFVQFFWTGTLDPGGSGLVRIDGSFAHPNTYATYLVFAFLFAVGVAPTLDIRARSWTFLAAALTGFLLVATFARGAWASFLLGSLLMASRINKKLVGVILLGSVGVAAAVPGVGARLSNLTATTGVGGGVKTDDSLGWRMGYWERIWEFRSRNPVFGLGIDATKTLTPEAKDPHNSFLQAFLEGGLVGGFAFVTVLAVGTLAAVRTWRRITRRRLDHRTSLVAVGAIGALFSVSAQLLTENVLLNTIVWWYMDIALAFLAVLTWRTSDLPRPDYSRLQLPVAGETDVFDGPADPNAPRADARPRAESEVP